MQWSDFLAALALFLVFEGLFPFVSPANWRKSISMISQLNDGQLRFFGLIGISLGLVLLLFVRGAA